MADLTDPTGHAYRCLAAAVLFQAIRDAESKNGRRAAAARTFLAGERAEEWAERIGVEPAAWRAAIMCRLMVGFFCAT